MIGAPAPSRNPVRSRLAKVTRTLHEDLHRHPLLEKLLLPDLSLRELEANAAVTLAAVRLVEGERQRLGLWHELSFEPFATELERDLIGRFSIGIGMSTPWSPCRFELLGGMYVMHGSAFGSAVIARAVRKVIPHAPASFFLPRRPDAWGYMCSLLETLNEREVAKAEDGALGMFRYYKATADRALDHLNRVAGQDRQSLRYEETRTSVAI